MAKRILMIATIIIATAFCTICATMRFMEVEVSDNVVSIVFLGNVWEKER